MHCLKYIPALLTSIVWGSTFVASKYVLDAGISPITLMTVRFILAYIILAALGFKSKIRFTWSKQEFHLMMAGLTGGSIYFIIEYISLQRTSAVNVGLISATVPIIATAISLVLRRNFPKITYVVGTIVAFAGVALLVTDGNLLIDIFPVGDILAIVAAILWAIYSVIISRMKGDLPYVAVSRRMMFYSLISILPFTMIMADASEIKSLLNVGIILPTIYLGAIASALCVFLWNWSIGHVGLIRTNNFLYLMPVVSLFTSVLFSGETTSVSTFVATVLILVGIFVADR